MTPNRAVAYANRHRNRFVAELKRFISFPSVSSQPKHAHDVRRCATWLAGHLRAIGLDRVELIQTRRHPIVYALSQRSPRLPTVLIYGHYDVVPADPLSEWHSPPFTASIRGKDIYGRGTSDDKGQLFAHVKAIESYLQAAGDVPLNVKCVFEGEEEIGSPSFPRFLRENKDAVCADIVLISDTKMLSPERPTINYAQRGVLSMELTVRGPRKDLHSGNFGGAIHNPAQAICETIGSLQDDNGRITIPCFYSDVREWSDRERDYMARTGPRDSELLRSAEVSGGWGEPSYTLYERTTIRPALTVNGISAGYKGPGGKGIIPAVATAKFSFRLVPDQDPARIERLVRRHIADITPTLVSSSLRTLARSKPVLVNRSDPFLQAAAAACESRFGARPAFIRSGGTIPTASMLQDQLGVPIVLMGFGLPGDSIHAPNEKFHLPNFHAAIRTSIWFLDAASRMRSSGCAERNSELALSI